VKVAAVVITYQPDLQRLRRLCNALSMQVAELYLVDNGSREVIEGVGHGAAIVIRLGENTGIAHAQNVGIRAALAGGAEVVVLFDQDSEPGAGYVSSLLQGRLAADPWVAAPVCIDRWTRQELPSYRVGWWGWLRRKVYSTAAQGPVSVDLVIASGCAASAQAFAGAGLMDEEFFIDFVDFEWCLRCRLRQIPITVVPGAVMEHSIGERTDERRWYRGSVHDPARTYYKIRNCFLLFRKPAVPTLFAISSTVQAFAHGALSLLYVRRKASYARMMCLGAWHGLCGTVGRNPVEA
jgi:rhamnosyltransferase